jgi:hypothetical protein
MLQRRNAAKKILSVSKTVSHIHVRVEAGGKIGSGYDGRAEAVPGKRHSRMRRRRCVLRRLGLRVCQRTVQACSVGDRYGAGRVAAGVVKIVAKYECEARLRDQILQRW